jgi:predicted PurR-regulated permease PerM
MALISKDSLLPALGVVGTFTLIQFLDNNLIVPLLVGGRIRINSIVAIAGVIAGGLLWGIPGMFLSLPLAAILKVVFDRIEPLKPWGLLLGDTLPARPSRRIKAKVEPK